MSNKGEERRGEEEGPAKWRGGMKRGAKSRGCGHD